jgi:flagellin
MTFSTATTLSNVDSVTQKILEELVAASGSLIGGSTSTVTIPVSDVNGNLIGNFTITTADGTSIASGITMTTTPGINGAPSTVKFNVASGTTIGFGGASINSLEINGSALNTYSIGAMTVEQTASSGSITISANAQNVNIQNLNTAAGTELDVTTVNGTGSITGGVSLAGLKALVTGQLTKIQADRFQGVVDASISQLNTYRSDLGSTQNQIESAVRNLMTQETNVRAAESVIRDVDYAEESANFNKNNIIAQAGNYAMSQANAVQQNVLRLLQ